LKEENRGKQVLVGVYKDGVDRTSMDMIQRLLCVLQCKYVDGVVCGVGKNQKLPDFNITNRYKVDEGFFNEFDYLNNDGISKRITKHFDLYIERQRKKGVKHEIEKMMK